MINTELDGITKEISSIYSLLYVEMDPYFRKNEINKKLFFNSNTMKSLSLEANNNCFKSLLTITDENIYELALLYLIDKVDRQKYVNLVKSTDKENKEMISYENLKDCLDKLSIDNVPCNEEYKDLIHYLQSIDIYCFYIFMLFCFIIHEDIDSLNDLVKKTKSKILTEEKRYDLRYFGLCNFPMDITSKSFNIKSVSFLNDKLNREIIIKKLLLA